MGLALFSSSSSSIFFSSLFFSTFLILGNSTRVLSLSAFAPTGDTFLDGTAASKSIDLFFDEDADDEQDRRDQDREEVQFGACEIHDPDRPDDAEADGDKGKQDAEVIPEDEIHGQDEEENAHGQQCAEVPSHASEEL